MRKWHFGDAKVPLLVYESAAFGCYMALADDVFAFLHDMPCRQWRGNGQKKMGNGFSEGCLGDEKGCLNSPFYRFNIC